VDITIYLPDDIGKKAKEAELPLSRMLRDAVVDELERREAVTETLADVEVYEVQLENRDGVGYRGRITGKLLAEFNDLQVFLTEDERVILYNERRSNYFELEHPEVTLREELDDANYFQVMTELGLTPVIDL
jgi:hypothetical protein